MKIAIIGLGHVDGILPLALEMAKKDHNIYIYFLFNQKHKIESIINFQHTRVKNGFVNRDRVKKILGPRINKSLNDKININIFILNSPKIYDYKNIILLYRLSRKVISQNFDVVNINGNNVLEGFLHLFLRNMPRIHTIHDPLPHSGEGGRFALQRNLLLSKMNTEFVFHADALQKQYKEVFKVDPDRMHSILYGSLDFYKLFKTNGAIKSEDPVILFYGRIAKYKGIEYLVKAFKIVQKEVPKINLIIAGRGDFYFDVKKIYNNKNIKIENRYMDNKELVSLIQKAWLVVCPYTDATQSGVVLTSYAFNTPVVATNVGGIPEVVIDNETGVLVPPKNSQALAEALARLINNAEEISRMEKNIEQVKKDGKISWNKIANQTLKVYQKAIRSS